MVWGGRRLGEVLGKNLPSSEPYGESWEVSDHAMHRSIVACGERAGLSLRDLMATCREELLGPAAAANATFPWLIKFLDAHDWLSVQVHPDEHTVKRLWPGEGSKTEAWFILEASPGSRIYAGLLPGVDEQVLRTALVSGMAAECLHSFAPRAGDCVFLPAGTVHAVGGGVLMVEVQETSDATFRLFDWNRRDAEGKTRALHIEEGLAAIDWKRGPVEPVAAVGIGEPADRTPAADRGMTCQRLLRCPHFQLEFARLRESSLCGGTGRLQALVVLEGNGALAWDGQREALTRGQVWVLPAALHAVQCTAEGDLKMLIATLP
jgi:mannose-6-phosphate isomerase